MVQWEWDLYVTVKRADGEIRRIPYGSWNDDLARRLEEMGATYELPELPDVTPPPDYGCPGAVRPRRVNQDSFSIDDLNDGELIECLAECEDIMSDREISVFEFISSYFRKFGYLDDKNRYSAERIAKRHGLA